MKNIALVFVALLLTGCASLYFHDAGKPPQEVLKYRLNEWPYDEYWTGVIFNGNKIGFTHLQIKPLNNQFMLETEAVIHFNFLGVSKAVELKAIDIINEDMQLVSFKYDFRIDQSRRYLSGQRENDLLLVNIKQQEQLEQRYFRHDGALYPSSVIGLYPSFHGLSIGERYQYTVFDGETISLQQVTQQIQSYESSDVFQGNAYKVTTGMLGQSVDTWIDNNARPIFEMSANGVLISALETETMAKKYLAQSVLNKEDLLLDYSLIKSDKKINQPGDTKYLKVAMTGIPAEFKLPAGTLQKCKKQDNLYLCEIESASYGHARLNHEDSDNFKEYLQGTIHAPTFHPNIKRLSQEIVKDEQDPRIKIDKILTWIGKNIETTAVDVFSSIDVLDQKKAECQGHSYLFASLSKSVNIPTKIVNGIVYSKEYQGFLYHTWVEVWSGKQWVPVDPTFGQDIADATHIKLIEGEDLNALSKLLPLVGKLNIEILEMR
jgi:hypothetical protein